MEQDKIPETTKGDPCTVLLKIKLKIMFSFKTTKQLLWNIVQSYIKWNKL